MSLPNGGIHNTDTIMWRWLIPGKVTKKLLYCEYNGAGKDAAFFVSLGGAAIGERW